MRPGRGAGARTDHFREALSCGGEPAERSAAEDVELQSYPTGSRKRLLDTVASPDLVAILTNGRVTEDKVGPHDDFLSEFPLPRAAPREPDGGVKGSSHEANFFGEAPQTEVRREPVFLALG
ncbi:MAG: hypothetical protein M3317_09430 [Actinomycetota bacterium]|nr:hypothetical protein [Actinomycetota bacterium]